MKLREIVFGQLGRIQRLFEIVFSKSSPIVYLEPKFHGPFAFLAFRGHRWRRPAFCLRMQASLPSIYYDKEYICNSATSNMEMESNALSVRRCHDIFHRRCASILHHTRKSIRVPIQVPATKKKPTVPWTPHPRNKTSTTYLESPNIDSHKNPTLAHNCWSQLLP